MSGDGEVVHELMMGEQAFAIIADAIRTLTIKRLKFQRLKDVIIEAINKPPQFSSEQVELYKAQFPLDGHVRIYLRLSGPLNAKLDAIKTELAKQIGDSCGVRETVIFCALAIAQRQNSY